MAGRRPHRGHPAELDLGPPASGPERVLPAVYKVWAVVLGPPRGTTTAKVPRPQPPQGRGPRGCPAALGSQAPPRGAFLGAQEDQRHFGEASSALTLVPDGQAHLQREPRRTGRKEVCLVSRGGRVRSLTVV